MSDIKSVNQASAIVVLGNAESRYCASSRIDWYEVKPGLQAKMLYEDEDEDEARGERTMLVRLDALAESLPHSHTEYEQV